MRTLWLRKTKGPGLLMPHGDTGGQGQFLLSASKGLSSKKNEMGDCELRQVSSFLIPWERDKKLLGRLWVGLPRMVNIWVLTLSTSHDR